MKRRLGFVVAAMVGFAGCSASNVAQYSIPLPAIEAARSTSTTIEVLEVSLPLYAQSQEIPVMDENGAIRTDPDLLWSDEPARAISLSLAESLGRMTGGVVAVEPWPLNDRADLRVDVRVKEMLASTGGTLRLTGQVFVVSEQGRRPRAEWFDVTVPLLGGEGQQVATATGLATVDLATVISSMIRR